MASKENSHVGRLHRYLPFSSSHDQIFEEYQTSRDSLNIDTIAFSHVLQCLEDGAKLVILTGDAGHGKTHLCRRLIEAFLGYDEDAARELVRSRCDGSESLTHVNGENAGCPLRVFKDFSELSIERAAEQLEFAFHRDGETAVVCANEGRLRAVLETHPDSSVCSQLLEEFRYSLISGKTTQDGDIHVVNLNYQSVASDQAASLVGSALREWCSGTRWRICKSCDCRGNCPISHNRDLLSERLHDGQGHSRQNNIELLYAAAERLGAIITIREMLMSIAYLITAGLTCRNVHSKVRQRSNGWQHGYAFYNILFAPPADISPDKLRSIPLIGELSRLDPGLQANREVDEQLINKQGVFSPDQMDLLFGCTSTNGRDVIDASNGIDDVISNPRTKKEREREAESILSVVRALRRRAFFDQTLDSNAIMRRLGLEYGDCFLDILSGHAEGTKMTEYKELIVTGLHTIQGLQIGRRQTYLHLVDPAFGKATNHAAIVARKIPVRRLSLLPVSRAWNIEEAAIANSMPKAVDWLERHVTLRVESDRDDFVDLQLDLMMFDCLARAASGYIAESFYAHDFRRVKNFLGRIAEKRPESDDDVTLFLHGQLRSISIDNGVIQVSEGHR